MRTRRQSFSFVGGVRGEWRVERMTTVAGPAIASAARLRIVAGGRGGGPADAWVLRGETGGAAYTSAAEAAALAAKTPPLGRRDATRAALIPIRKSPDWWGLNRAERHLVYASSRHTAIGLEYLPRVARRLHHCQAPAAPFDFLTWFEFAPAHEAAFDELLARLRASAEWGYVEREVDIRLHRAGS